MKYQFVLETGNWKPWFLVAEQKSNNLLRKKFKIWVWLLSLVENHKTNNQQLLRNKLKQELKYEVNLRFET